MTRQKYEAICMGFVASLTVKRKFQCNFLPHKKYTGLAFYDTPCTSISPPLCTTPFHPSPCSHSLLLPLPCLIPVLQQNTIIPLILNSNSCLSQFLNLSEINLFSIFHHFFYLLSSTFSSLLGRKREVLCNPHTIRTIHHACDWCNIKFFKSLQIILSLYFEYVSVSVHGWCDYVFFI